MILNVDSTMIKSPTVVAPQDTVGESFELMRDCDIRHLPVVENGNLVGIVSDRDLRAARAKVDGHKTLIEKIMNRDVLVARKSSSLVKVISAMLDRKVGSVVVLSAKDEVSGIFTTTDALCVLLEYLEIDEDAATLIDDPWDIWTDHRKGDRDELPVTEFDG